MTMYTQLLKTRGERGKQSKILKTVFSNYTDGAYICCSETCVMWNKANKILWYI